MQCRTSIKYKYTTVFFLLKSKYLLFIVINSIVHYLIHCCSLYWLILVQEKLVHHGTKLGSLDNSSLFILLYYIVHTEDHDCSIMETHDKWFTIPIYYLLFINWKFTAYVIFIHCLIYTCSILKTEFMQTLHHFINNYSK